MLIETVLLLGKDKGRGDGEDMLGGSERGGWRQRERLERRFSDVVKDLLRAGVTEEDSRDGDNEICTFLYIYRSDIFQFKCENLRSNRFNVVFKIKT